MDQLRNPLEYLIPPTIPSGPQQSTDFSIFEFWRHHGRERSATPNPLFYSVVV